MAIDRRALLKLLAGATAAGALGAGSWTYRKRRNDARESDRITEVWPELGDLFLLPNLRRARVVCPDRPHAIREVHDPEARRRMTRKRAFKVSTSARRLRADRFDEAPADGAFRILALGDSVTFGWGLADDESWPARLQRELTGRGHRVEVLNAGSPANKVSTISRFLKRIAPSLQPHGVLFAKRPMPVPGMHDIFAQDARPGIGALGRLPVQVVLPPVSTIDLDGMAVWESVAPALRERLGVPVLELTGKFIERRPQKGCVLVGTPKDYRLIRLETGEEVARGGGDTFEMVNIYEAFERDHTVREPFFFDQGHLDADGCRLMAELVADSIERAGWFG